jgi:hypothetical protein
VAVLAGFTACIDLKTDIQGRHVGGALITQASGVFQACNTMNPVKVLGNRSRFVALDSTDEMPLQFPLPQPIDLYQRLLKIALSEALLSEIRQQGDLLGTTGFADSEELYAAWYTFGCLFRLFNSIQHYLVKLL